MGQLVVLAYSGGLDTSAIVPWLKEKYDARVLCYAAPPATVTLGFGLGRGS